MSTIMKYITPIILLLFLLIVVQSRLVAQVAGAESLGKQAPSAAAMDDFSSKKIIEETSDWEKLARSTGSADAWMQFYLLRRLELIKNKNKMLAANDEEALSRIYNDARTYLGNGLEANWMLYLENYMQNEGFEYLEEAYSEGGSQLALLPDVAGMYLVKNNTTGIKKVLKELQLAGYYDQALMIYAKNTLKCLPANAILITSGSTDTWPILIQQQLNGIRQDVSVIYIDGLLHQPYREKIAKEIGNSDKILNGLSLKDCALILVKNTSKKRVYFALTLPENFHSDSQSDFEIDGLSLFYSGSKNGTASSAPIDTWNRLLDRSFAQYNHPINRNYLPLLFDLRSKLKQSGNTTEAAEIESAIRNVADKLPQKQNILKMLE